MIIEEIRIGNFCGIRNRYMTFDEGVNLIEGNNESGKSRVLSFIRFIFYGAQGAKGDKNGERALWFDFDGGKIEGSLTLSCDKGRFRVERSLDPQAKGMPEEEVRIIDLAINSPIKGSDPAHLFLGVDRELFSRSLFMAQLDGRAIGREHLSDAVENMLSSADETVNSERVKAYFSARLKKLEGGEGSEGLIAENAAKEKTLEMRLSRAREDEREEKKLRESILENEKKIRSDCAAREECRRQVEHTDALRAIDRLKKAGEALDKKEKAEAEISALRERYAGKDGFYPDRAYVREIRDLQTKYAAATAERADLAYERSAVKKEFDALPEPIAGNKGKLLDAIGRTRKNAARSRKIFLISAVAAVLFTVLLVLFFFTGNVVPGGIFSGLALISLVLAIVFYVRKNSAEREEYGYYARIGVRDPDELDEAVERHTELTARRQALQKKIDDLTGREENARDAGEKLKAAVNGHVLKWKGEAPGEGELPALIEEAEQAYESMAHAKEAEKNASELMQTFGEFDPDRVRALIEEVKEDGVTGELSDAEYKSCRTKINFYTQTVEGLEKRVAAQNARLSELKRVMEDVGALEDECEICREEAKKLQEELRSTLQARELAFEAIDRIRSSILPSVLEDASAFLDRATGGKYLRFSVDADYYVRVQDENGALHAINALSAGTLELCYIALRLGVSGRLYKERRMPYFFDESFAHFDDMRKASAFMALSDFAGEGKGQLFILACHKRDGALLEKITAVKRFEL